MTLEIFKLNRTESPGRRRVRYQYTVENQAGEIVIKSFTEGGPFVAGVIRKVSNREGEFLVISNFTGKVKRLGQGMIKDDPSIVGVALTAEAPSALLPKWTIRIEAAATPEPASSADASEFDDGSGDAAYPVFADNTDDANPDYIPADTPSYEDDRAERIVSAGLKCVSATVANIMKSKEADPLAIARGFIADVSAAAGEPIKDPRPGFVSTIAGELSGLVGDVFLSAAFGEYVNCETAGVSGIFTDPAQVNAAAARAIAKIKAIAADYQAIVNRPPE